MYVADGSGDVAFVRKGSFVLSDSLGSVDADGSGLDVDITV